MEVGTLDNNGSGPKYEAPFGKKYQKPRAKIEYQQNFLLYVE